MNIMNSVTGISYASALVAIASKRYYLAAHIMYILSIGSLGAFWTEYSARIGKRLMLSSLLSPRKPNRSEVFFAGTHFLVTIPASILLFYLARERNAHSNDCCII